MSDITNKTEALDYIYEVYNNETTLCDQKMKIAKSFFTEQEFKDLYLNPDIIFNNCFPGITPSDRECKCCKV